MRFTKTKYFILLTTLLIAGTTEVFAMEEAQDLPRGSAVKPMDLKMHRNCYPISRALELAESDPDYFTRFQEKTKPAETPISSAVVVCEEGVEP